MDEIRREIADRTPGGDVMVLSHPSANTARCQKFPSGKRLRVGTMFSGIGAPETAWRGLGWDFRWCAEIEPFPSAVLAHRFPDVRNLGDVTKVDWDAVEPVDLLCFGSPCQSFSVAGKRLGLDDPRGNLALYALGVARRLRPRWLVFENVPGLLSSDGTGDFGAFLGLLGECGYGFAYRVLDAQHFGVPQRRRRLFVVGCLGDWTRAAAVLFERESLQGNPPPRREAGERVAHSITAGVGNGSRPAGATGNLAFGGNNTAGPLDVATAVNAHGGPHGRLDFESETFIAHSLRADGFDASEDGTGRGTPLVPITFDWQVGGSERTYIHHKPGICRAITSNKTLAVTHPAIAFNARQDPDAWTERCGPLDTDETTEAVAFDTTQITSPTNGSRPEPGDPCHPLAAGAHPPAVAFNLRGREGGAMPEMDEMASLRAASGGSSRSYVAQMAVRRLTPRECERLQGFPDDFTLVPYRGKPAADGNRYKALGNSMAVPVVRWLGERIAQADRT